MCPTGKGANAFSGASECATCPIGKSSGPPDGSDIAHVTTAGYLDEFSGYCHMCNRGAGYYQNEPGKSECKRCGAAPISATTAVYWGWKRTKCGVNLEDPTDAEFAQDGDAGICAQCQAGYFMPPLQTRFINDNKKIAESIATGVSGHCYGPRNTFEWVSADGTLDANRAGEASTTPTWSPGDQSLQWWDMPWFGEAAAPIKSPFQPNDRCFLKASDGGPKTSDLGGCDGPCASGTLCSWESDAPAYTTIQPRKGGFAGMHQSKAPGYQWCAASTNNHAWDQGRKKTQTTCHSTGSASRCINGDTDQCYACPTGRYQSAAGASACLNCPIGKFTATNAKTALADCTEAACGLGNWCDNTRGFDDYDWFADIDKSHPTYDTRGSPHSERTALRPRQTKCAPGKYNDVLGAKSAAECKDCIAGKYGKFEEWGYTAITSCTDCSAGLFSAHVGFKLMNVQFFEAVVGGGPCSSCSKGRWSAATGVTSNAMCAGLCSVGRFGTKDGAASNDECIGRCAVGKVGSGTGKTDLTKVCANCAQGKYNDAERTECIDCKIGFFQYNQPVTSECAACTQGLYQDEGGKSACKACAKGTHDTPSGAKGIRVVCPLCPKGFFSATAATTLECTRCLVGLYTDVLGASACKKCAAGTYSYAVPDVPVKCPDCPKGRYDQTAATATPSTDGGLSLACDGCAIGTFAMSPKSSVCTKCQPGRYSLLSDTASTFARLAECPQCPKGRYDATATGAAGGGALVCTECEAGTFASAIGLTACQDCDKGKFSSQPGFRHICVDCPGGRWANVTKSLNEAACVSLQCPVLPLGANYAPIVYTGAKGQANNRDLLSTATIACSGVYKPSYVALITCTWSSEDQAPDTNAYWKGLAIDPATLAPTLPLCVKFSCDAIPSPNMGSIVYTNGRIFPSTATYTCAEGYGMTAKPSSSAVTISSGTYVLDCTQTGWADPAGQIDLDTPTCIRRLCPQFTLGVPIVASNATGNATNATGAGASNSAKVVVSAPPGYDPDNWNNVTYTADWAFGDRAMFSCDIPGVLPTPYTMAACQANGKWFPDPEEVVCAAVPCFDMEDSNDVEGTPEAMPSAMRVWVMQNGKRVASKSWVKLAASAEITWECTKNSELYVDGNLSEAKCRPCDNDLDFNPLPNGEWQTKMRGQAHHCCSVYAKCTPPMQKGQDWFPPVSVPDIRKFARYGEAAERSVAADIAYRRVECRCKRGFINVEDDRRAECVQCEDGTYTPLLHGIRRVECRVCPISPGVSCNGGILAIKPSYWYDTKFYDQTRATRRRRLQSVSRNLALTPEELGIGPLTQFVKCLHRDACLVTLDVPPSIYCHENHTGMMCSRCYNRRTDCGRGDGQFRAGDCPVPAAHDRSDDWMYFGMVARHCVRCPSGPAVFTPYMVTTIICAGAVLALALIIITQLEDVENRVMVEGEGMVDHNGVMPIVRMLLNWLQATALLSVMKLRPPEAWQEIAVIADYSQGISTDWYIIECAVRLTDWAVLVWSLFMPFAAWILPAFVVIFSPPIRRVFKNIRGRLHHCYVKADKYVGVVEAEIPEEGTLRGLLAGNPFKLAGRAQAWYHANHRAFHAWWTEEKVPVRERTRRRSTAFAVDLPNPSESESTLEHDAIARSKEAFGSGSSVLGDGASKSDGESSDPEDGKAEPEGSSGDDTEPAQGSDPETWAAVEVRPEEFKGHTPSWMAPPDVFEGHTPSWMAPPDVDPDAHLPMPVIASNPSKKGKGKGLSIDGAGNDAWPQEVKMRKVDPSVWIDGKEPEWERWQRRELRTRSSLMWVNTMEAIRKLLHDESDDEDEEHEVVHRTLDSRAGYWWHFSLEPFYLRRDPTPDAPRLKMYVIPNSVFRAEERVTYSYTADDGTKASLAFLRVGSKYEGEGWVPEEVDGERILERVPALGVRSDLAYEEMALEPAGERMTPGAKVLINPWFDKLMKEKLRKLALKVRDIDGVTHRFRALGALCPEAGINFDVIQHVLPVSWRASDIGELFNRFDADGDGILNEDEYFEADPVIRRAWRYAHVWQQFSEADLDRDGVLNVEEMRAFLPMTVAKQEAPEWLAHYDRSGQRGVITISDLGAIEDETRKDDMLTIFGAAASLAVFVTYIKTSRAIMMTFAMETVEGETYLRMDSGVRGVEAFSGTHIGIMILAVLYGAAFIVGIPCAGLYVLYEFRKEMHHRHIQATLGFLFEGYSPNAFYWEFVVLFRKIVFMAIAIFWEEEFMQSMVALVAVVASIVVHMAVWPYEHPFLNIVELLSLFTLFSLVFLTLVIWYVKTQGMSDQLEGYEILVTTALVFQYGSVMALMLGRYSYLELREKSATIIAIIPRLRPLIEWVAAMEELILFKVTGATETLAQHEMWTYIAADHARGPPGEKIGIGARIKGMKHIGMRHFRRHLKEIIDASDDREKSRNWKLYIREFQREDDASTRGVGKNSSKSGTKGKKDGSVRTHISHGRDSLGRGRRASLSFAPASARRPSVAIEMTNPFTAAQIRKGQKSASRPKRPSNDALRSGGGGGADERLLAAAAAGTMTNPLRARRVVSVKGVPLSLAMEGGGGRPLSSGTMNPARNSALGRAGVDVGAAYAPPSGPPPPFAAGGGTRSSCRPLKRGASLSELADTHHTEVKKSEHATMGAEFTL